MPLSSAHLSWFSCTHTPLSPETHSTVTQGPSTSQQITQVSMVIFIWKYETGEKKPSWGSTIGTSGHETPLRPWCKRKRGQSFGGEWGAAMGVKIEMWRGRAAVWEGEDKDSFKDHFCEGDNHGAAPRWTHTTLTLWHERYRTEQMAGYFIHACTIKRS